MSRGVRRPESLRGFFQERGFQELGRDKYGLGHSATQHLDLSVVVRVDCEVNAIDCQGLEARNLNAEGVDAKGNLAKLVRAAAGRAGFEDCLCCLIG
nr:hypothetical protein [Granulicella sp. S190]